MTYVKPFISLSFGGTLANGEDIWSCGMHLSRFVEAPTPITWFNQRTALINSYRTELQGLIGHTSTLVPTDVKMTWVKMALIGTDGLYMEAPVEVQAAGQGYHDKAYVPQNSIVTTLSSIKWKDPGKYNRFYLPMCYSGPGTKFTLSVAEQNAYVAQMMQSINNLNALDTNPSVEERTHVAVVSASGTGWDNAVDTVKIGRVIDTQRRRRNKLNENYVERSVIL